MNIVKTRIGLLAALLAAPASGCTEPNTSAAIIMRSLEERRANSIVGQAIEVSGERPKAGRTLKVDGGELQEDFLIGGGPYGIAYLTEEELAKLGDAIPKHDPNSEQLRLIRPSDDAIVLVLYHHQYRYDAGDAHSVSVVTVEMKLEKDVVDFMTHVVKQRAHQ